MSGFILVFIMFFSLFYIGELLLKRLGATDPLWFFVLCSAIASGAVILFTSDWYNNKR